MANILIIDDDEAIRDVLSLVLTRAGHRTRAAADGIEAMRLFAEEKPDIVVTDIIMPEMEGIQAIREIRAADPTVKIIAISGGGRMRNIDVLDIARKLGADDIVAKPFSNEDIVARVAKLAAERRG